MINCVPIINCDTLILRPPKESDIDDRMNIGRSKEFVRMCGGNIKNFQSFTKKALLDWYDNACNTPYLWIAEKNHRCIGNARLILKEDDNKATYSIGIFDELLYSKGFGTIITKAVIKYAFDVLNLHRVTLKVLEFNERAIRCYEKCGFIREGLERESVFMDGEYYSDVIMGILDREFKNLSE